MNKTILSCVMFIISLMTVGSLAACANRSDTGLLAGGILGGVAGSALTRGSTVGTVAGAVGGALVGRNVARQY